MGSRRSWRSFWRELFEPKRRKPQRKRLRILACQKLDDRLMLHDGDHDFIDTGWLDEQTQIAPVIEVEPNDTLGQSNAFITASDTLSGSLANGSDVDVYSATFAQGDTVTLASGTDPGQLHYSPTVELVDSASNLLARAADGSRIIATVPAAGTYYVRVLPQSQLATYTGSYAVTVTTATFSGTTETESNDSLATANPLSSTSTSFRGSLSSSGDVDHFSFAGTGGRAVAIRSSHVASRTPAMRLYDSGNNLVASSLDGTGLSFVLPSSGTYRIAVATDNSSGTVTGDYVASLVMSSTAPTAEIEPNSDFATATPWTSLTTTSTRVTGKLSSMSDVDLFAVDFVAGNQYSFSLDTPSNSVMRQERLLALYNEFGQILEYSVTGSLASSAATGFGFRIERTGRHYIGVSARTQTGLGGYVLSGNQTSTFPTQRDVPLYFHDYTAQATHLGYGPVTTQIPAQYHNLMVGMFEGQYDTYDVDVTTIKPATGTTYVGFGAGDFGSIGAYGYGGSFNLGTRQVSGDSLLDDSGSGWTRFDSMRNAASVMNQETGHATGLYAHARNPLAFMAYDDQTHLDVIGTYYPFPWTDSRVPDVESRNQREFLDWVLQSGRIASEVESNNTLATAQNLTSFLNEMTGDASARNNRVALSGKVGSAADTDLYSITVSAGDTFALDIDAAEFQSPLDAELVVLDSAGNEIASNLQAMDRESGLYSVDPYLMQTFVSAGTYYLRVRGEKGTAGNYRLKVTRSDAFDAAGPRVNAVWPNGASTQDSTRQITFWLNDKLDPATINASSIIVQGATTGLRTGSAWFEPIDSTLVWYADAALPADTYTVTLVSGAGGVRDLRGNALDGETGGNLVWPAISGNGATGGNFVSTFTISGADSTPATITGSSYRRHPYNRGLFSLNWSDELDIQSVQTATWVLRGAGADALLATADDTFSPVDITYDKSQATNGRTMNVFTRGIPDVGSYRLEANIRDAAGNNVNVSRTLTVTASTQNNGPSVVDVNVQPNTVISSPLAQVDVIFSGNLNLTTLNTNSFKLLQSPDPTFFDGNDTLMVDADGTIAWDAVNRRATFQPASPLANGYYLIQLDSSILTDTAGRQLDGEFLDTNIAGNVSTMLWTDAPSGDGLPGGDYRAMFSVFLAGGAGNDAPILDISGTPQLTNVPEDSTANNGDLVSSLLGASVYDPDAGDAQGIAVVGLTGLGDGTWEYSLDDGNSWTAFVTPTWSSSLLLRTSDRVRFLPAPNFDGIAQIQYRAWDQTSGIAGTIVDTSTFGGSTPYSSSIETALLRISEVNDAPTASDDALLGLRDSSEVQTITTAELIANDTAGPAYELGQTLTIVSLSEVIGGTAVISGSNIIFTPSPDFRGTASLRYVIRDDGTTSGVSQPLTANAVVTLTLQDINDAPQAVTPIRDMTVVVTGDRQPLFLDVAVLRPGNDEGEWHQSLTVTLNSVPNPLTGALVRAGSSTPVTTGESLALRDFLRLEYLSAPGSLGGRDLVSYSLTDNGTTNGVLNALTSTYSFFITTDLSSAAQVVRDINSLPLAGVTNPTNVVNLNGLGLFFATDSIHGTELWRTDATTAGTELVRDIRPGRLGQSSTVFVVMGGVAYFSATDGTNGTELWRTDGTYAGTYLVKDISTGGSSSSPTNLVEVGGIVYFAASDSTVGQELWRTDGTAAGTYLVADINAGTSGSNPGRLSNVNGVLMFQATSAATGAELWRSDGTSNGTSLITDFTSGTTGTTLSNSAAVGNLWFFTTSTAALGTELYATDGTSSGTILVRDINAGVSGSSPGWLTNVNGTLFFSAASSSGTELWRSDGTSLGTTIVRDIYAGSNSSTPANLVNVDGTLFFAANSSATGNELWRYQPTIDDLSLVADISPGTSSSTPSFLAKVGNRVYFVASTPATGFELWSSDGTSTGTALVTEIIPGTSPTSAFNNWSSIVAVNNVALFPANDSVTGFELWRSDSSSAGTQLLRNINTNGSTGSPARLTPYNNRLLFTATDPATGNELWSTDGTSSGTALVADLVAGTGGASITQLITFGAWTFFNATAPGAGVELWKTDGTSAGTTLVADTVPGSTSSSITFLTVAGDKLFFINSTTATGAELWVTDGTSSGTLLVSDILPGASSSTISNAASVGNLMYFRATNGTNGQELWVSDGTSSGTTMVRDINPGTGASYPTSLINLNGTLLFYATNSSTTNYEIWRSNGTSSGTSLVREINASGSASPSNLVMIGNYVYFSATDGLVGSELWRTNGTSSGTNLVLDIRSGSLSGTPASLTSVNGQLFFTADDGVTGRELWTSDGTSSGTRLVNDIIPGVASSNLANLTAVSNLLYFRASNAALTNELWRSNGTSTGTMLVSDVFRGGAEGYPTLLTNLNGNLLFVADNGANGSELLRFVDNAPTASSLSTIDLSQSSSTQVDLRLAFADDVTPDALLNYQLVNNSNPGLFSAFSLTGTTLSLTSANTPGTATITVAASDALGQVTTNTFDVVIIYVNSAPVLNNSTVAQLATMLEDTANSSGTLISALIASGAGGDPISDVDLNALEGIAITGTDTANGSWEFALDGNTWSPLGTVSLGASRLLAADANTRIRFVPNANFFGTVTSAIHFHAWDQTSGANGGLADITSNGGATAYSSAFATAALNVVAVNDVPTAVNDTLSLIATTTNIAISSLLADDSAGPSNEADQQLTLTAVGNSVGGTVQIVGNNVVFTPTAGFQGTGSFQYTVQDDGQTNGVNDFKTAVGTASFPIVTPSDFFVSSLTPTATGFTALFNRTIVASALNLYTTQALAAASDVTLTGSVSGAVRGSIVLNAAGDGFTFVATAGLLASNQTYTVTLRSGADAFQDSLGGLLDGNADGTPGDNYSTTFNVAAPSGDRRTLSVPNFARGFGQDINLPASGATGIPVTLSDGTGVQSVDFDLAFDPALLTITNVTVAAGITGNVSFNTSTIGLLRVSYFSSGALPTGSTSFLNITADVPDNAPYSAKHVLDLRNISINEGTIASIDDDAVHVAAYLGDATGNRGYSGLDASLISRVVVGLDTGHAAYPMLDPIILSDVTANGGLSGLDASLVAQKVVGLTVTQIPALPGLEPPTGGGPDPKLYIPQSLSGQIGQTITVPLMLDVTDAGGIALQAGDYALSFDPTKFSVANARLGTLDATGFGISANVNNTLGTITVSTFATGSPVNLSFGTSGSVVLLDFTVLAGAALGSSAIDLENDIGGTFTSLNEGGLTLVPAPTNNANDPVDGLFTIQGNTPDVALSVSSASLSESGGTALVIATLTQTTSQTVTVNLTLSGTATNNVDYSASATAITIPAGQLSAAITVTGVNDATFEGNESLVIDIASATNANENGVQQQTITITDDDSAPLVNLAVSPSSFFENDGTTTVTATLTNPSTQAVTINLAFSGTATSGVDYSASATTITIPAGSTAGSITLTGLNDFTFEGNESLVVDISNVTGGSENNTQQVTATITDDESVPLVNLALAPNTFAENGGTATVTATLTNPSTQAVTINLAFSGAATSGVDYSASATTITIPAGSTAGSITLTGLNDLTYENDESLLVDISNVTGGSENGTQQVTATISDDDSAPSVQFQLANSSTNEAAGNVTIVVTLSAPSAMATSVPFTLGGTATNADRTVSASPLVIAAGQTSAAIVVSVVNDSLDELNESVVLQLGTPTNATLGANSQHKLTIVDNDAPPVVQFTTLSQSVNESTPTATAIIRLTQPSGLDVTVPITVSGSATNADASVSTTLPITIPAGQTSAAITVAITDDTAAEPTETLVLTIGTPSNATRGAVSAHTLSILDNDSTVAVQLAGGNFNVGEASGSVPLVVTLSTFALQPITVPLILSGSADGQDYRLSTTSVTIPAGQTRAIVTLTVTDDQRDELPETLTIQLGTPIGGELGTNTAVTVTIDDNDPVLSFVRSSDTTSDESGTITVIARALSPVIADLTVPFTSFGSATLGVDYTLSANAFQFLAGASTAAVTLTIVDDAVVESSEAVTLSLQPPPNTSLGSPGLFTLFISDNDTPLAVGLDLNGLAAGQDFLSPVGEFVEDAAALTIVPNATVVPPGVQTLSSLTVYLESAPNGAAESLTAVNSGGASATAYNPSTRSLTISGGTTSEQQAVLRSVAYQNSSQNPTAGGRFITVTANFSASTESRRRKLNVTPVDDAPVVTITAGTPTYVTGNSPLIVDAGIALTDIENNRLVRAEVTITDAEGGDVLSLSSPVAGFTSTFAGNVLTITANAGSGNLAAFRSALSRVQFSTTTIGDGNRSVSFVVTDTSGLTGIAGATSAPAVRAITVQSPLLVAASLLNSAAANESLTQSQLAPLVHEALARWESAGATAAQLNVLRAATIEIRDLSHPRTLALAGGSTIVLDTNASGRGWFVDSTPSLDEEFTVPLTTSAARAATGPTVDRVDLLTTILHEYGHLLGLDDHLGSTDLLAESLPLGTRRNLSAVELSHYFAQLGD